MKHHLPALQRRLAELVAIPSMSAASDPAWDTGNRAVIDRLAEQLTAIGFAVDVLPLPGQPARANLIARLGGDGDHGLVLAGHADTVPAGDSGWSSDPFQLTERDGRWYGLGSTDMKGFFPLAMAAAEAAMAGGRHWQQPLTLVATADEETSMAGARALLACGRPKAAVAVIGEPTDLKPVRLHKGMMMESLTLHGQSGHSSNPALGRNAIDAMADCLDLLQAFRERLRAEHRHGGFALPQATLNFGALHGGQTPNKICAHCRLDFDLRPLPGMDLDGLRRRLQRAIDPATDRHGVTAAWQSLFPGVPPFETAADTALVRLAERLSGHAAGAADFATEAPFFQQLGMETLVLGPGSIACAHQPDEWIDPTRLPEAIALMAGLIDHYCLQPRP